MPPRACPGVGATKEVDEATEGGPLPDLTEGGLPDGGGIAGERATRNYSYSNFLDFKSYLIGENQSIISTKFFESLLKSYHVVVDNCPEEEMSCICPFKPLKTYNNEI